MLGFVDRGTKEVRIYYINNNRTKEKILPIVKNNVYSYQRRIINTDCLLYIKNWILIDQDIYYIELITRYVWGSFYSILIVLKELGVASKG